MENRLSDGALVTSLDAGHQSLPWDAGQPAGFLTAVDLRAIMQDPAAAQIIPSLPVQPLYYALKRQGLEDHLDVLPLLTQEQVTRMVDYDAWSADRLVPKKLFDFLKPFGELGPAQLYQRFSELDEEYQLAALQGKIQVYEAEHIYDLPESVQERVRAMPCGKVFYELTSDDPAELAFIEQLIDASKDQNLRYVYALLGHAAFTLPNEQEALVHQFRRARMEEDGFVSFEESQALFRAVDTTSLKARWAAWSEGEAGRGLTLREDLSFLDQVLLLAQTRGLPVDDIYAVHQSFLYLANALCAATRVEADDMHGLHRLLEQSKALASFGLEYLADGDAERGLAVLRQESAKVLFQVAYTRMEQLRATVIERLVGLNLPRAERLQQAYRGKHWGAMLLELDRHWIERVGLEAGEILKGLLNRFPMYALQVGDDAQHILFRPITSEAAFRELELSLAGVLGWFALVSNSGMPLDQPFELILRERAIQILANRSRDRSLDLQADIPSLLREWRAWLVSVQHKWFVGQREQLDSALQLVESWVHDGLHGLLILPRSPRSTEEELRS